VSRPSKKEHRHGGAACRYSDMSLVISAAPPPGAPTEGDARGQCGGVLSHYVDWQRKKYFLTHNFILVCFFLLT